MDVQELINSSRVAVAANNVAIDGKVADAIDPRNCGCLECITGEYIPENALSGRELQNYEVLIEEGLVRDNR